MTHQISIHSIYCINFFSPCRSKLGVNHLIDFKSNRTILFRIHSLLGLFSYTRTARHVKWWHHLLYACLFLSFCAACLFLSKWRNENWIKKIYNFDFAEIPTADLLRQKPMHWPLCHGAPPNSTTELLSFRDLTLRLRLIYPEIGPQISMFFQNYDLERTEAEPTPCVVDGEFHPIQIPFPQPLAQTFICHQPSLPSLCEAYYLCIHLVY